MKRKTATSGLLLLLALLGPAPIATAFVDPPPRPASSSPRVILEGAVAPWRRCGWLKSSTPPRDRSPLRMTDDDENNPLSRGVDSVAWLPSVNDPSPTRSVFDAAMLSSGGEEGDDEEGSTETLPLFPLGGIVYTPNSEHILNIFEPRYRQMYNDILMNGSKRFAVSMCHPSEEGRFARVGVLFSLEELKEVSEMTADQVKYICNHRVTGRVKLHKVLNPEAWENRDTYLKVKGTIINDCPTKKSEDEDDDDNEEGMDESVSKKLVSAVKRAVAADAVEKTPEEEALAQSFGDLVELQHDLSEDVRFTRASVKSFGVVDGTEVDPNLWTSIRLWQSYAEQRLVARQNEMQKEFQERLVEYLKKEIGEDGGEAGEEELPSAIGFQDLSPELQTELVELQKRMTAELKPLMLEQTLSMQLILEAADHEERVELMRFFIDAERKRLQAKKTLKSMFRGSPSAVAIRESDGNAEEAASSPSPPSAASKTKEEFKPQFFANDEDAFQ